MFHSCFSIKNNSFIQGANVLIKSQSPFVPQTFLTETFWCCFPQAPLQLSPSPALPVVRHKSIGSICLFKLGFLLFATFSAGAFPWYCESSLFSRLNFKPALWSSFHTACSPSWLQKAVRDVLFSRGSWLGKGNVNYYHSYKNKTEFKTITVAITLP